ncbi:MULTISPECIES: IclR family transcriptional regulator domain-containing protein [unclassified Gordonia (in: high G+C Gram-positive bacteria)]
MTTHTVVAPGVLDRQLDQIRRLGYATTTEEMTLGACSIAVPIRTADDVVAALGVVVPSTSATQGGVSRLSAGTLRVVTWPAASPPAASGSWPSGWTRS